MTATCPVTGGGCLEGCESRCEAAELSGFEAAPMSHDEDRIAQLMAALNIPCPECGVRAHFPCVTMERIPLDLLCRDCYEDETTEQLGCGRGAGWHYRPGGDGWMVDDGDTHEARVLAAAGEWTAQELHIISTVMAQMVALIEGPPVHGDERTVALCKHIQRKAIQLAFKATCGL